MRFKFTFLILILTIHYFSVVPSPAISINNSNEVSLGAVVVPNAYSGSAGTATFLGPFANAQRTYQMLINESELSSIFADMIESITFRLPVSATANWPSTDITFSNYDIYLSGSVAPQDRSLTFASNVVGIQKLVRSGSLTIPANSYTSGGNPNAFGLEISFDSAYMYNGGHLLIEIRHNGFSGTSRSLDAIGTSISGYGTLFSACWTGSYTGTSGTQGNFTVASISVGGIVGVQEISIIPESFTLSQNYPNPFNPITNIEFSIPKSEDVKITVYDSQGKELVTLLNQRLTAGSHKVDFDGAKFSSGVYFYKLETESFIQTKSMVLLK